MKDAYHYRLNSQNSEVPIFCCLAHLFSNGEGTVVSGLVPSDASSSMSLYNNVTAVDKRRNTRTLLAQVNPAITMLNMLIRRGAVQCERQEVV